MIVITLLAGLSIGFAMGFAVAVVSSIRIMRDDKRPYTSDAPSGELLDLIEDEVRSIEMKRQWLARRCCEALGYSFDSGSRESMLCKSIVYRAMPVDQAIEEIMAWKSSRTRVMETDRHG